MKITVKLICYVVIIGLTADSIWGLDQPDSSSSYSLGQHKPLHIEDKASAFHRFIRSFYQLPQQQQHQFQMECPGCFKKGKRSVDEGSTSHRFIRSYYQKNTQQQQYPQFPTKQQQQFPLQYPQYPTQQHQVQIDCPGCFKKGKRSVDERSTSHRFIRSYYQKNIQQQQYPQFPTQQQQFPLQYPQYPPQQQQHQVQIECQGCFKKGKRSVNYI